MISESIYRYEDIVRNPCGDTSSIVYIIGFIELSTEIIQSIKCYYYLEITETLLYLRTDSSE